jgi:rsbT co-antagonist protein RsbR
VNVEGIMQANLRTWLNNVPISDPLERRQAGLLQIMLLIVLVACLIGLMLAILTSGQGDPSIISLVAYPTLIVCTSTGIALLRRGRFTPTVILATVGLTLVIGIALIATGFRSSGTLLAFTVPITLAGLVIGRRGLLIAVGLSILIVVVTGLLTTFAPEWVGFVPGSPPSPSSAIPSFILIIGVLSLFLDRFGNSLREALVAAQIREQELERLRGSLEDTVAERTAALQHALQEVEQREGRLAQTLADLQASESAMRELSAPIIPILPGVLVAPLIGALDSARARILIENVLGSVERASARHVIFDITGVPLVDTQVARVLLDATTATRLLGAQIALVGIRPEVAQTIVSLGIDFSAIATYPNLQEAVEALLVRN